MNKAVLGAEFIIHDDLNKDSYTTANKETAVGIDVGQMAATIGSIVGISAVIAATPVELPAIAIIGAGIFEDTLINMGAQAAKKESIH